ncbi:bifunctional polysaccharide deacetylase/glycosyltransferase family 2 protein [Catellatospora sp. KI3]|uniref:bifunctional polysaccharide deacetylase/glycosyltransferase family 2 protein n=1 Tax=Catellatospora sp. KI3 TaxID=3041620 RepID=UPI002482A240|nr:bifunctional polysaccharide deacetylase/glycosyltransferase family 2 protein [Catellatospora sp. KI3]MDI1466019.1 bifunctional polysaccharide deacetylase/glycosyltransferase family 2 protein [Catellatospora sp. KI3]
MSRHVKRREARAHWVLLVMVLAVALGGLCLNGYVEHVGAEGSGPVAPGDDVPAPDEVLSGGPVLRPDPDGTVTSRSLPARTIALTFDDGPDPVWTPKVLDVLARHHVPGTFFVVGAQVNKHPDIARRIAGSGSELAAHTFTHANLGATAPWLRDVELTLTDNAVAGATGRRPTLLRPPYSSTPDAVTAGLYGVIQEAGAAGYLTVLADLDTRDWSRPGVDAIVSAATPQDGAGAVVMMHDSGGDRSQTVAALDVLIPRLQEQGYKFTTVSQALRLPDAPPAASAQRLRGQALRWAQLGSGWLATVMTWLMSAALILGGLRLVVQVWCTRVHVRRVRRSSRRRRRYLGPVSVIVPAFNESANIQATVRSLVDSDYPEVEVIVVDDGSSDGTAELVRRMRLPHVQVIEQENAGKPTALNTGVMFARGDILVMVDGDTVFEPDSIGELVQPLADPEVGAVSGNTKVANRGGLLGRWQHLEYVMGFNLDRRMFDVARCMPTVPGAIGAFRREAVVDVGGVSTQTLAEDTDFTMAIIRAGWRVVYAPDAIAWTEAPSSLRQLWRQRYRWCYGTMQAMWKHRRSLFERGSSGVLGRRGLAYLLLFQVILPLSAPMVDVYGLYGAFFLPPAQVAAVWLGFTALQMLTAAYALRLDGERLGPVWSLPLQQIVYRQLMYLVVIQSTVMALIGDRLRWHRMVRTGAVAEHARTGVGAGR